MEPLCSDWNCRIAQRTIFWNNRNCLGCNGEFTRLGGHVLQWFGVDVSKWAYFELIGINGSPLNRTDGWIVIGMLVGALMMILLSSSFKIRIPNQKRRLVQGFIGGIIAGFGARLAMGCNLAAFLRGFLSFLSTHGFL